MPHSPPGAKHARNFAQARVVVGEVAKPEGGGDQVEMSIGKRQPKASASIQRRTCLFPSLRARCSMAWEKSAPRICAAPRLARGASANVMSPVPQQRSSTRAPGRFRMCVELSRRAPPPQAVDVERENVIQQVVARRNRGKHLAHRLRGRLAIARSGRRRADDPLFDLLSHVDCQ